MDAYDAIISRRTIRKFTSRPVDEDLVKKLLRAGLSAPSARNTRAWHFVVIDKRELLDAVAEFHQYASMIKEAPLAIAVLGDTSREDAFEYVIENCSAATENILLAAHSFGLGGCWLGITPREQRMKGLSELLGLPEHLVPISLVAIGWPDEKKPGHDGFDESYISYNRFE